MLRKGRQFLLHTWYPSCYSCYKLGDKSWIRKGPDCDSDKQYISVVICEKMFPLWAVAFYILVKFTYITVFRVVWCALMHNAHPLFTLKISRKKIVRVYNAQWTFKKIAVWNVRIKYQSYIFFSPLSIFHLLGEFIGFYWRTCDFPVWVRVKHIVPVYNAHPSYKLKNLGKILHIIQP
jgi:hypothetical protein